MTTNTPERPVYFSEDAYQELEAVRVRDGFPEISDLLWASFRTYDWILEEVAKGGTVVLIDADGVQHRVYPERPEA